MDVDKQIAIDENDDQAAHTAAYIYTPASQERPTKRRRENEQTRSKGRVAKGFTRLRKPDGGFPSLLNGQETSEAIELRFTAFETLWKDVEGRTNDVLKQVNEETLAEVSNFVQSVTSRQYNGRIPTGLILAGPNIASHSILFSQIQARIQDEKGLGRVVVLTSKDATNLKTVLKRINVEVTDGNMDAEDENDEMTNVTSRRAYFNYDPQILCNWCQNHKGQKIVIAIQDTEAFETAIMTDLITLLYQFTDRIQMVLLLGIATSEEIFHDKLPKSTIQLMRGERFDVQRFEDSMDQVFKEVVLSPESIIKLGPQICDSLFHRLKDHTRSVQSFLASLKYAYMSHFYANPLTVVLGCLDDRPLMTKLLSQLHLEAFRNTSSFRKLVELTVEKEDVEEAKSLLNDDSYLRSFIWFQLHEGLEYGSNISKALSIFQLLLNSINYSQKRDVQLYDLYSRVLFGDFCDSPLFREIMLSVKKMNSEAMKAMLDQFMATSISVPDLEDKVAETRQRMDYLAESKEEDVQNTPKKGVQTRKSGLISEFDITNDSMRTTVLSGRVRLDELKKGLTKQDKEYSDLVKEFTESLEQYFRQTLVGVDNICLNELLYYDIEPLHSAVFSPSIRPAIERALSAPMDYLASEQSENMATQPVTSILYQLYLNAGQLINIYDLWSAFLSFIGKDDIEDGEEMEELQALFYKGLAEMKYMGMIKYSKRKTDHLQKLAWKGL